MDAIASRDEFLRACLCQLRDLLQGHRYTFRDEVQLHEAIAMVLEQAGIPFAREKVITPVSRLDFYLPLPRIGIEVKTQGSAAVAWRQVERYLAHDDVDGVLLAASRSWARMKAGVGPFSAANPKPIAMAYLTRPL
ncbi:MAG TPA: hypothetical protein VM619_14740 [Luteimonas sp.]|nr:hypothetical protein [Luteimonas sp.]